MAFQSTRPVRGATSPGSPSAWNQTDFNPRAPCGARRGCRRRRSPASRNFNPRAPCRARRKHVAMGTLFPKFQSTRPVRGATRHVAKAHVRRVISIHAPRAGRDDGDGVADAAAQPISIHAPRAGRDVVELAQCLAAGQFQSTRPVRGATTECVKRVAAKQAFQSTRPVRGATVGLVFSFLFLSSLL